LASLVIVVCVAQFQSNHRRSATSPCTRLSQSVRRLHISAGFLHRTHRREEKIFSDESYGPPRKLQQLSRDAQHTYQQQRAVVGADRSRRNSSLCRRHQHWVEIKDKKLVNPHRYGISKADE